MVYAVIIAGGKGTRLWPKSTPQTPKHLLPIISDNPMLEDTIERIEDYIPRERILIVTAEESRREILDNIPNLKEDNILGEPQGKNSAPAIAYAAAILHKKDPDSVMVVLPADHFIPDEDKFISDIRTTVEFASDHPYLVTFGIPPTRPDTGYGYIELEDIIENGIYQAKRFTEKPNYHHAKSYVESGNYVWNSGMFIWSTQTILDAFKTHNPNIYEFIQNIIDTYGTDEFKTTLAQNYEDVESISIDYAIMENAERVATKKATFRWDDVGSWQFLSRIISPDSQGNIVSGDHIGLNTKNCIIYNEMDNYLATIGLEDVIIVTTPNGTLVCQSSQAGDVKKIVRQIEIEESMNKNE